MELSKTLVALTGLFLLGLIGSAPALAQTETPRSYFAKLPAPFTTPVLLDSLRTESDKLFLEIETPERKIIVGRARTALALLTTRTLKYNGGTMSVPEGANLLVVSRSAENRVTWQFYKATNPKEWLSPGSCGVTFRDKTGQVIATPTVPMRISKPTVTTSQG
ncbi:MAG: hypothetical protein QM758_06025 [Armatimonas sp.]